LGILYDHRDTFSQFIVKLVNALPIFHGRVELEKTSISHRSQKFFTLNGISDATRFLLGPNSKNPSESEQKLVAEFWDEVSKNMPDWQLLINKKVSPKELRQEYVHAHTNLISALGMAGKVLLNEYRDTWKQKLKGLQKVDWSRDNKAWNGSLLLDGRLLKNRQGMKNAANQILLACGVSKKITDFEVS